MAPHFISEVLAFVHRLIELVRRLPEKFIYLITLVSLVFATIGSLGPFSSIYETTRFVLILLCSIVALQFLISPRPCPLVALVGYALFIASGFISLGMQRYTTARLADLFHYGIYFLAMWLAAASYLKKDYRVVCCHVDWLLAGVGISLFIYACLSLMIYVWFLRDGGGRLDAHIPYGFINIRYWSHLASWFLPLVPIILWRLREKKFSRYFQWGGLFGAGIWIWILLITTARGSMISIAVAAVMVTALMGHAGRLWLKDMVKVAAVGLSAWLLLSYIVLEWIYPVDVSFRQLHTTSSGRVDLWLKAWELSLQNFPFGIGPLGWISPEVGSRFGHPHNMFLMWAAEWGWLAVAGLLVIAIATLYRFMGLRGSWIHEKNLSRTMPIVGLLASVTAGLAHAQLSAVFISPPSMLVGFWILVLFMAVVWQPWAQQQPTAYATTEGRKVAPVLVAYTALSAVLFTGWYAVLDYYRYMEEKIYVEQELYPMAPRFWVHGHVQNFDQ